jgi:SCY1-like protein 2
MRGSVTSLVENSWF